MRRPLIGSLSIHSTVADLRFAAITAWVAIFALNFLAVGICLGQDEQPAQEEPETEQAAPPEDLWTTNAEEATKQAKESDRDMLLLFTGSDWCPPCIKLENEILSKAGFYDSAVEKFVLVKFDFPQNTQLAANIQRQNDEWSNRYGIESFPTVVLVDKDLNPYAITGYREEASEAYMAHLDTFHTARVTRDEFLKKADNATGKERATFLDQALSGLDSSIVEVYYEDLLEEIGELDEDDELGLRTKYFAQRDREIHKAVMSSIAMVARLRKPDAAVAFIDESLAEHNLPLNMMITAQNTKLRLLRKMNKVDEANSLIDSMIAIEELEPTTRQRLIINKSFYWISLKKVDEAIQELKTQIQNNTDNLLLTIALGELHDSQGDFEVAIKYYDQAIAASAGQPEILVDVLGAKADAQYELGQNQEALTTLDGIVANDAIPGRLRAESLLHKALVLREEGRRRAAILAENKAVEIVDNANEKAEVQKLVDQFRKRFGQNNDG